MVEHDLATQPMALDVEKPGGVRLIAAGHFEDASDQETLRFGQAGDADSRRSRRLRFRRRTLRGKSRGPLQVDGLDQ